MHAWLNRTLHRDRWTALPHPALNEAVSHASTAAKSSRLSMVPSGRAVSLRGQQGAAFVSPARCHKQAPRPSGWYAALRLVDCAERRSRPTDDHAIPA